MKKEYGYASLGSGMILIEVYNDGVLSSVSYSNENCIKMELAALKEYGYNYSEECTKRIERRIESCRMRMSKIC